MSEKQRIETETGEHREAYRIYLELGKDRSLAQVAQRVGKTVQAVSRWSSSFGWVDRVNEAERVISVKAIAKTENRMSSTKIRLVDMCHEIVELFLDRIRSAYDKDGNLDPLGWRPSAYDVKMFLDILREVEKKGAGDERIGPFINRAAIEEMGIERFERFLRERLERLSRLRTVINIPSGDGGVGT